ncbi:MAG TPA: LytTR family DNA-binding domain-containing protein [Chitinophagaceae bacterium]
MKILIIENEPIHAEQLKSFISNIKDDCSFFPVVTSIRESIILLSTVTPDLIFMDIELSDGAAFDIFRETTVKSPVVFTTAYNQYMTDAFDNNGIAYLLKPIRQEMVEKAFQNLDKTRDMFQPTGRQYQYESLKALQEKKPYKTQFLVKQGQKLIPVKTTGINHFFYDDSLTYLVTTDKKKFVTDETLSELETILHPDEFFRVNRKFLVSKKAILSLDYHSKGQVAVNVNLVESEKIIVSRQQTPLLKMWLNL